MSVKSLVDSVVLMESSHKAGRVFAFWMRPAHLACAFKGLVLLLFFALSGCVVRAPQIESLTASMNAWFAPKDIAIENFRWTARVGTEGRLLTLYEVQNQYVFASDDGADLVVFDGWVVRRVQGFGFDSRLEIKDEASRRRYRAGADSREGQCQPFENVKPASQDGMLRLQYCSLDGNSKPNVIITLDSGGDIVAIEQSLGLTEHRIELRRLKP